MDFFTPILPYVVPILLGIFGAGGAGTLYYRRRSQVPLDIASAKKIEAETSMVVVEQWQILAKTLQKECQSLRDRVDIVEKKLRDQEEERVDERLEYKKKINSLEIELSSVISSSNYKDKQIIALQERVTYLEGELRKYNATV